MEKPVKGYEGLYEVSDNGDVISYSRNTSGKNLKPQKHTNGYRYVTLCNEDGRKNHLLHRLVAEAFIPNSEGKACINHLDGDKTNNCVDNLQWVTYSENNQHAWDTNLAKSNSKAMAGSNNHNSKLTENDVRKIHSLLNKGISYSEIADMYNVTNVLIGQIQNGKAWTHVENNLPS